MRKHSKAFSIIEVVLVLAISGLIFTAVFVVVPALRRSVRNNKRRADVARFMEAVNEYYDSNRKLPFYTTAETGNNHAMDTDFVTKYIDPNCKGLKRDIAVYGFTDRNFITYNSCSDEFNDPSGQPYIFFYLDPLKGREGRTDKTIGGTIGKQWYDGIINSTATEGWERAVHILTHTKCDEPADDGSLVITESPTDVSMLLLMEGGAIYCLDNTSK